MPADQVSERPIKMVRARVLAAAVEALERRALFSGNPLRFEDPVMAASLVSDHSQLVFTDIATGNTNGAGATAAQTITVRNTGLAPVTLAAGSASIVDDASVATDDASQFEASGWPTLPVTIPVGESVKFNIVFRAADVSMSAAIFRVATGNGGSPNLDIALRGIGTTSDTSGVVSGSNEASLQRVLNAFRLPINVGDTNGEDTYDLPTPRPAGTVHDEVEMQRLVKAGDGPVIIEPLAEYAFNTVTGPVGHYGYYSPGTTDSKIELFAVAASEATSTDPTWGASFDPGSSPFGLYGEFNGAIFEINGLPRGVYSEDTFNTFDTVNTRKVRFFPLKKPDGTTVANAYVFAFEEFNAGYDSNDIVGVIYNVAPAATGPEVGLENRDRGTPYPNRLVFSRIEVQPPVTNGVTKPNNVVHNKATVRVYNSGTSALTISSAVLSNTSAYQINTTGLTGATIAAGSFKDIEVQFKATSGRIHTGTLTINTNDADEPATVVQLAGYWQEHSENNEEPTIEELMTLFGYGTLIINSGQTLNQGGLVTRVGDEVLSPYWRRADGAQAVEVIQLNAYHTHNEEALFKWHFANKTTTTTLFTQQAVDGQSILPHLKGSSTQIAGGTFKPAAQGTDTNPAFGFKIDGEWSDPTKNTQDPGGGARGHHVRFWVARDSAGNVIPDTYLLGMDYQGINYDYQDNMYLIRNIKAVSLLPAVTGQTATASGAGISLDWNDNSDANLGGYNVYRGTSASFTPSASNKLNTAGVLTSSAYVDAYAPTGAATYYKITAADRNGTESATVTVNATRSTDSAAPGTPASLLAATSNGGIVLDWAANTELDVAGYLVRRSAAADGTFTSLTPSAIAISSFIDSNAPLGVASFYRVIAVDSAGNQSAPATASEVGPEDTTAPAAPASLTATGTGGGIALDWAANTETDLAGYLVRRSGAADGTFTTLTPSLLTADAYLDADAPTGAVSFYRVVAVDANGNESIAATASASISRASVADVSVAEPLEGTAVATFTVSLNVAPTSAVTVNYATANGTAEDGVDYAGVSGTLTFLAGEQSKTVDVLVNADLADEVDETFVFTLAGGTGGVVVSDGLATGTIANTGLPTQPLGPGEKATFTGSDGRPVTVSIKGAGTGVITVLADGLARIVATGTTAKSSIVIAGVTQLQGVTVTGPLKALTGKTTTLAGNIAVSGPLAKLQLADVSGGRTITAGPGGAMSFAFGSVSDLSINSQSAIKSIKVLQWLDTDATPDTITAPLVTSISSKGDFAAGLTVGALGKLSATGTLSGAAIRGDGAIGTIKAGAIRDSLIFAGVASGVSTLPDGLDDYVAAVAIKSVTVSSKLAAAFSNTLIAAKTINKVALGALATDAAGTIFGVSADEIRGASATLPTAGKISLKSLTDIDESFAEDNFAIRVL